jgi:dolichol-phosphate mannosyltransferase
MLVAVIIPVYNESQFITQVLRGVGPEVSHIIVVDDCSTDNTVEVVHTIDDPRITIILHEKNSGVGGAMICGYRAALKLDVDVFVKIDGDGQMASTFIPKLITPITKGLCDYIKGSRFHNRENLVQMPYIRLLGNIGLSFLTKVASGYWNIFDSTSGFTAIHREALIQIDIDSLDKGYFFETNMLIQLYHIHAVVRDVPILTTYGEEKSELRPLRVAFSFSPWLVGAFIKRIIWRYFLVDFTATSLFLLMGAPLFLFGVFFGAYHWFVNYLAESITPLGTIMIAAVSLIIGFQMLLQAVVLDIHSVPQTPLQSLPTLLGKIVGKPEDD